MAVSSQAQPDWLCLTWSESWGVLVSFLFHLIILPLSERVSYVLFHVPFTYGDPLWLLNQIPSHVSFLNLPLLCQHLFCNSLVGTLSQNSQWQISFLPPFMVSLLVEIQRNIPFVLWRCLMWMLIMARLIGFIFTEWMKPDESQSISKWRILKAINGSLSKQCKL